MRRPNFFIVGAPKCGTTALSEYLRAHPEIYMSTPKEPYYFAEDLSGLRQTRTEKEYLGLFDKANKRHVAVGEASAGYILSDCAIQNIFDFSASAKIVLMLRNPVEMVYSFHSQALYDQDEDEGDFEKAWRLQATRKEGRMIPRKCRTPRLLQYAEWGRLSPRVTHLLEVFPREQIFFGLLDDLVHDPGKVYSRIVAFLGVENDARKDFPRCNENKYIRGGIVGQLYSRPGPLEPMVAMLKKGVPDAVKEKVRRALQETRPRPKLRKEFRRELVRYFSTDVAVLSRVLGRDFSHWK